MSEHTGQNGRLVVGDLALEALRLGDGRPLLILHGGGGVERAPYLDTLAQDFEVIAPSHPGFGHSPAPDEIDTIDDLAYLYLDFLRDLARPDTVLMGYSMGGWIAAEIAVRDTRDFSHLILVDPVGIKVGDRWTRDIPDIFAMPWDEVTRRLYHDPEPWLLKLDELSDEQLATVARNREALALYTWEPYMHNPKLKQRLHRVDVPTLLLWGESDGLVGHEYMEAFASAIPGARLETIPEAGHRPYLEQPDRFVNLVHGFAE